MTRAVILLPVIAVRAWADGGSLDLPTSLLLDTAPAGAPDDQTPEGPLETEVAPHFGEEGFWSWSMQLGTALADDSIDHTLTFNIGTFLSDDFEFIMSFGGWYFGQEDEDDAIGASFAIGFRTHVIEEDRWTGYVDLGIGVLGTTDEVPDEGTSFNFMPRVGIGATYRLGSGPERLDFGVRWHHISNATILGSDDNPARDGALLYVGIIVPF